MRIEVQKTDAFTNGAALCIYRGKLSAVILKTGLGEWTGIKKLQNEYDIPHDLAFSLMKCMGHDPVYVDEAESEPVKIADPDMFGHTEAWLAVAETLDELVPDWLGNNLSSMDAACAAIRALHAKANGTVPVPSPDPHAEWREAVTEWVREWGESLNGSNTFPTLTRLTTRVIEAAERAKAKENQK